MTDERWYVRHAWVYFVIVAVFGLVSALAVWVDPSSGETVFEQFGFATPAIISGDPEAAQYVEHVFRWAAGTTVGLDLFALLIAVTAFRKGERWAWLAFWFWPLLFLSHFVLYESGFRYAQLVWLAVAIALLVVTAPKAWSTAQPPSAVATSSGP